jgi:hypothetical protein
MFASQMRVRAVASSESASMNFKRKSGICSERIRYKFIAAVSVVYKHRAYKIQVFLAFVLCASHITAEDRDFINLYTR